MKKFYHRTEEHNVPKILAEGLKTGAELGVQRYYYSKKAPFNPDYIYLAKNLCNLGPEGLGHRTLVIALTDDHPVERDMDIVNVIKNMFRQKNPLLLWGIMEKIRALELKPVDNVYDLNTTKKIRDQIKIVPEDVWDRAVGFYRTPLFVPNKIPYNISLLPSPWN